MTEQRLPVLTRYVHDHGRTTTTHHVMCPRRAHTIDADTCWGCADVRGVMRGAGDEGLVLVCEPEDASPAPVDLRDAAAAPITAVMARDVHCVRASALLDEVADLFVDLRIGALPVVDLAGQPVGVITKTDLLRALSSGLPGVGVRTVDELMTPVAFSVSDRASVAQAAAMMAFEGVHHVPVLSSEGAVVGIVSALDVARFVGRATGYLRPRAPSGG